MDFEAALTPIFRNYKKLLERDGQNNPLTQHSYVRVPQFKDREFSSDLDFYLSFKGKDTAIRIQCPTPAAMVNVMTRRLHPFSEFSTIVGACDPFITASPTDISLFTVEVEGAICKTDEHADGNNYISSVTLAKLELTVAGPSYVELPAFAENLDIFSNRNFMDFEEAFPTSEMGPTFKEFSDSLVRAGHNWANFSIQKPKDFGPRVLSFGLRG